jgi:2,4-dienoyl-CoA reductase-like NADH-dependent reductase (Old Yellow Enzyme family)
MTSVGGSSTPHPGSPPDSPFPHVFRPVTLGTMKLRNRIMLPPHGSAIGNLLGSPADAARNIAYWRARAADGAAWLDAVRGRVRNRIVPGFEPHGYGAETAGNYRSALFVERVLADGHADVVGMARAYIAEPAILTKARAGGCSSWPRTTTCRRSAWPTISARAATTSR